MTVSSRLIGVGSYLPHKVLTNDELSQFVDTSDEWIFSRTGISQRHIADSESCADMAYSAALKALNNAQLSAQQIDAIIVATTTADKTFPSVACQVQNRLGANGCCAFDVQAVCAGFVYALGVGHALITSGTYRRVLVIGSDAMTRLMDWRDRSTCVLFGDGAGAMILCADAEPGIIDVDMKADGQYEDLLHAPFEDNSRVSYLKMEGSAVFKVAVREMSRSCQQLLLRHQLAITELDWLVPHQANKRIMSAVAKSLDIPEEKTISTIQFHANTSAASIPMAFDHGVDEGKIKSGHWCLLTAFGGGFSWGSVLLKF